MRTARKRAPDPVGSPSAKRRSVQRIPGVSAIAGVGCRRSRWRLRLGTAQPAHGIRAHAPERDLRGLGLLALAVLALILRTDEHSIDKNVVALVESVGECRCEAVERDNAVPLGFRLPLVVRVLPRLLRGDRKNREGVSVAAYLALLRVFPEEAN